MKKKAFFAELAMLAVVIIWGLGFPITQIAIDDGFGPFTIISFRFVIGVVFLAIIFWKRLKTINRSYLKNGIIIGFLFFAAYFFQTYGLIFTTNAKNAFITQIAVILTPFISWLFYRHMPPKKVFVASFITFFGIVILTNILNGFNELNIGDFWTFICAIFTAVYVNEMNRMLEKYKYDTIAFTIIQMFVAAVFSLFFAFSFESVPQITFSNIQPLLFIGILNTALGCTVQTIALKYSSPSKVSIIVAQEALIGTIAAFYILNEAIEINVIIGGLIMIVGLIICELDFSKVNTELVEEKNNE